MQESQSLGSAQRGHLCSRGSSERNIRHLDFLLLYLTFVLTGVVNYMSVRHFYISLNHLVRKGSWKSTPYLGKNFI